MSLDFSIIEHLFPDYLTKTEKGRLLEGLTQFKDAVDTRKWSSKVYTHFYASKQYSYFLQGDLVREIRYPDLDHPSKSYLRTFTDAIILSNTCDLDLSNTRKISKQVVLAPLIEMESFEAEVSGWQGSEELVRGIKAQTVSNIFYLPPNSTNSKAYICHFDKAFWFPAEELNLYTQDLFVNRISSLDYFGFYLFLVKLSYNFCRLPEDKQR